MAKKYEKNKNLVAYHENNTQIGRYIFDNFHHKDDGISNKMAKYHEYYFSNPDWGKPQSHPDQNVGALLELVKARTNTMVKFMADSPEYFTSAPKAAQAGMAPRAFARRKQILSEIYTEQPNISKKDLSGVLGSYRTLILDTFTELNYQKQPSQVKKRPAGEKPALVQKFDGEDAEKQAAPYRRAKELYNSFVDDIHAVVQQQIGTPDSHPKHSAYQTKISAHFAAAPARATARAPAWATARAPARAKAEQPLLKTTRLKKPAPRDVIDLTASSSDEAKKPAATRTPLSKKRAAPKPSKVIDLTSEPETTPAAKRPTIAPSDQKVVNPYKRRKREDRKNASASR